jgi:hypothetical protein
VLDLPPNRLAPAGRGGLPISRSRVAGVTGVSTTGCAACSDHSSQRAPRALPPVCQVMPSGSVGRYLCSPARRSIAAGKVEPDIVLCMPDIPVYYSSILAGWPVC